MSKINNNNEQKDMHSHNVEAYKFLDLFLPKAYVKLVQDKLTEKGKESVSSSLIRNVRNQTNFRNDILLLLVEVAKDNKEVSEKINQIITT